MQGISFHDSFKPKGCKNSIDTDAITAAAGSQMLEINAQAALRNLTIVSGGAGTVGIGGYLTGGGHAALSSTYGLAADQVLEISMVTPSGDILTANECQNSDLFWAMRGGGGSTFGVITSVTFKAYPSFRFATALAFLGTSPFLTNQFWDVIANVLSQYPELDSQGISAYTFITPNFTSPSLNITSPLSAYYGIFSLPLLPSRPSNTTASLVSSIQNLFSAATKSYPGMFFTSITSKEYPNFNAYYILNNGPLDAGSDVILGSRLLDAKALTGNLTALKETFKAVTPVGSTTSVYLVAGKGVSDAVPRGGGDAVNPAWRRALVHTGKCNVKFLLSCPSFHIVLLFCVGLEVLLWRSSFWRCEM